MLASCGWKNLPEVDILTDKVNSQQRPIFLKKNYKLQACFDVITESWTDVAP